MGKYSKLSYTIIVICICLAVLPSLPPTLTQLSMADSINPGLFGVDTEPYGLAFPEWSAKWWNWYLSIPEPNSPGSDATGVHCSEGQNDQNVWYLTGADSGKVVRTCTIPVDRGIPINVAGNECSYAENPALKTEEELRSCAIAGDQVSSLSVNVDGTDLKDLDNYVVVTPLFDVTFPENNIFGAPPGPSKAVSHSYLIFLEPLPVGNHTIKFHAAYLGTAEIEPNSYDVEYKLQIVEPES